MNTRLSIRTLACTLALPLALGAGLFFAACRSAPEERTGAASSAMYNMPEVEVEISCDCDSGGPLCSSVTSGNKITCQGNCVNGGCCSMTVTVCSQSVGRATCQEPRVVNAGDWRDGVPGRLDELLADDTCRAQITRFARRLTGEPLLLPDRRDDGTLSAPEGYVLTPILVSERIVPLVVPADVATARELSAVAHWRDVGAHDVAPSTGEVTADPGADSLTPSE